MADGRKKAPVDATETQIAVSDPTGDKLRESALAGPQDKSLETKHSTIPELFNRYGVLILRHGGQLDIRLKAEGEDKLLLAVSDDQKGLDEAGKQLEQLTDRMQKEISGKYGITFSKEGDTVDKQVVLKEDGTVERGDTITARAPKPAELYGIEAALSHASPSFLNADGQPLKFYFLKDPYVKGIPSTMLANFIDADAGGRPAVYFDPADAAAGALATEKDAARWGSADEQSIESTVVHELAHNTQKRLGLDADKHLNEFMDKLGWVPYMEPTLHEIQWLIKTKNGDLYRVDDANQDWVLCDKNGHSLDKDHKPADDANAQRASNLEIRANALVHPPTDYFRTPFELDAEALMLFRINARRRAALLADNPQLYGVVKEQDQSDINANFGVDGNGRAKMIRNPDGALVPNDSINQGLVSSFEANKGKN